MVNVCYLGTFRQRYSVFYELLLIGWCGVLGGVLAKWVH
jgi:hypothetical protein